MAGDAGAEEIALAVAASARDHPVRPDLDADHGLRLQQVIEAVETDLIVGD
jgi:hypothetical protein